MGEQDTGPGPSGRDWAGYLQTRVVDRLPHSPPTRLRPACTNGAGYVTHTPYGDVQTGAKP
jgi:hypothetical protein